MRFFTIFPQQQQIDNKIFTHFQYVGLFILALFTCFCIFANLITFFLLIFSKQRSSSRTTNLYIISLCLADLGIGCVVMPLMLCYEWRNNFPQWLCQFWQLADLLFCTESLYSICAIALDRVWNLEKPLRVFTSSKNRAKRLMLFIWILPVLIWMPVYFVVFPTKKIANVGLQQSNNFHCFPSREVAKQVFWVALPALYLPAIFLICLFLRISFVVNKHLKFLREHSSLPNLAPLPTNTNQQPLQQQSYPIQINQYENGCNKIERIEKTKNNGKRASVCETSKNNNNNNKFLRKISLPQYCRKSTIAVQQINEEKKVKTRLAVINDVEIDNLQNKKENNETTEAATFFISEEEEEKDFNLNKHLKQRQQRLSSARFSIITFSENIALILQREGVTQQIKAAKAVALILCCFLLCWFPFLLVWPLRIFMPNLISDRVFRLCLWLNYSCSTFNPLLYTLSTPKIRSLFNNKKLKFIFAEVGKNKKSKNDDFV